MILGYGLRYLSEQPHPLVTALRALINPSGLDNHLIVAEPKDLPLHGDGPITTLLHVRFNEDIPKVDDFAMHLWEQCFFYALPKRRQNAFLKEMATNPSVMMRAVNDVRDSFIKFNEQNPSRASEVAEVLAYCVVQHQLEAAQVVAKMGLKTSSNMPVHGLDGIHAKFENGAMTVYFLEAKLAGSANSGAKDYANSASNFLKNHGQYLREYQIVNELGNFDVLVDEERQLALDHFDILGKPKVQHRERYVGIICHTEKAYLDKIPVSDGPVDAHEKHFGTLYAERHQQFRKAAGKHLKDNGATADKCLVFFVGVPDVNELRKKFYKSMGFAPPAGIVDIAEDKDDEDLLDEVADAVGGAGKISGPEAQV